VIDVDEAVGLVENHVYWFRTNIWATCRNHRNAYEDRFWLHSQGQPTWRVEGDRVMGVQEDRNESDIHPTEVNLVRPWVISFLSSLYYDGIRVVVEADEIPADSDEEAEALRVSAIRNLLNRFAASSEIEDASERLYSMGLTYPGGCAFKLALVPPDERLKEPKAIDLIRVEAVPPWECIWDRRVRTIRDQRYCGHLRPVEVHRARREYSGIPEEAETHPLPDVVQNGFNAVREQFKDEHYVWILDLDDYTATEEIEGARLAGSRSTYLVDEMGSGKPKLTRLKKGPTPYSWPDGSPMTELFAFISEPVLERPMDSLAPAATVYELNAELNRAQSIVAGQFRRDASRIVFLPDTADEEFQQKVSQARDWEIIKVPPGTLPSNVAHMLESGQISSTLREYVDMVRDGIDRSQITADTTRGKAGEYLSATEAGALVDFTESTLGRFRKRSDLVISTLFQGYLRMLSAAMEETGEKSIPIKVEGEVYNVTQDDLARRWSVAVVDTASTPRARGQKLADFQAALPTMMELSMAMDPPDQQTGAPSQAQQNLAKTSMEYLSTLLNLPPQFDPDVLLNAVPPRPPPIPPEPEPTPPPAATPSAAGQGGQLPPEEAAALVESPAAQAIVEAAEAGL
jgi:hypothetical protein